ncbi:exonuclease SbcCD subunit D [Cryobacterium sp. BB307]|uniref:exonuclease SbcCD subunit D n=1 Tax=Cryobacterium sp. BB307 TaxID=2716317 RepID=UPI001447E960|nr:exonuclease SbcCD subunit D [Cryobacterium sp. BB307]
MRLLHTSDWHIGRTFHGHPTTGHLREVLDALVTVVRDNHVDVVLVAGDVFDSATPAAEYYEVLTDVLREIRGTGATVVLTSGNHDSATRLGFQSDFASLAGIHVVTRPELHDRPIELSDEHGNVAIYGIPFLEPALVRHRYPDVELRTQADVLRMAMDNIRADVRERGTRSVVLSHCFAANVGAPDLDHERGMVSQTPGLERDLTAGGLDVVPLSTFDGVDYVALGHIHGRAQLSDSVRYSGAPLHYSFSEAAKPRGVWLVDLNANGLAGAEWVDLPIPRRLSVLTGTLDELLGDPALANYENDWVCAFLTDQARPLDAMRRLQARFPWCAHLEHRPSIVTEASGATYAERLRLKSDSEIVDGFLEHVRNGVGTTVAERAVIAAVIAERSAREVEA